MKPYFVKQSQAAFTYFLRMLNNVMQSKVFPFSSLIADYNKTLNLGIRNWIQRHIAYMLKYCEIGGLLTALMKIQLFLDVIHVNQYKTTLRKSEFPSKHR
jgi:hypothetical protein